jgi:phenylalanyl-tRNA synthetase beta chain
MLVSWQWLSRYLNLTMSPEQLADSLSLSGLNHESTSSFEGDVVIDLEVTSNRGDCLGHIGVAREIAVLYGLELKAGNPQPVTTKTTIESLTRVSNAFEEACPRYTARLIRGCKVKPSPVWMQQSLRAINLQPVNNVVDVTNYVMMECGQPLHAFDFAKLAGPEIQVRRAAKNEVLEAIDHKSYTLDDSMCVIADAKNAVAVAGVMGGAATEVTEQTTDLLIEAAVFTPMSVRKTARQLKLHSPSSFRFERRVDPAGVDWASRRACELILELAGGELVSGVIDTAPYEMANTPITFRLSQIERILGIKIDREEVDRILTALGCGVSGSQDEPTIVAPTWRHDLTREADLIEEVARIHGYDKIPENSPISVAPSAKRDFDHATEKVRSLMLAAGISEAMTPSIVTETLDQVVSPWSDIPSLQTITPLLKGANRLRRSLLPSLMQCRSDNWAAAGNDAELYEIAHVYLPAAEVGSLPTEQYNIGMVAGRDFFAVKGIVEKLLKSLGIDTRLTVDREAIAGLDRTQSVALFLDQQKIGFLGTVDRGVAGRMKLPGTTTVAELSLPKLFSIAKLVPQHHAVSQFPSISRDLNMIVSDSVHWVDLETSTRVAVGLELSNVEYRETYRATDKDGDNTKRILFRVDLQKPDATLTGDEADSLVSAIVSRCQADHGAKLLV